MQNKGFAPNSPKDTSKMFVEEASIKSALKNSAKVATRPIRAVS